MFPKGSHRCCMRGFLDFWILETQELFLARSVSLQTVACITPAHQPRAAWISHSLKANVKSAEADLCSSNPPAATPFLFDPLHHLLPTSQSHGHSD